MIEVPLIGLEADPVGGDGGSRGDRPPVDWRRAIWIAVAVGAALGIGAAVIRSAIADDGDETATLPADELATAITTPPTLAPLDTLPPPDLGAASTPSVEPLVSRPVYREVWSTEGADPLEHDLATGVELLDRDVARRSETHVELGNAGFVVDVSIERDPIRDRYQILLESRGATQLAIVDIATGTTYINPGTEDREEVLNADIIAGSGAADVNEYFDRLLLGPVRSDTYVPSSTQPGGLVRIDGVGVAHEFVTNITGDLIPEWQLYAFSPVFEFPVEDRPTSLEYAVYVTADGEVVQVDGVSFVGDVAQLVQHRLVALDDVSIELPPPPPLVTGPPVTVPGDATIAP